MPDPTGRISHQDLFHRGMSWKTYCRVATTGSVTIATALNAGDTIDGVTLAAGDRVLVKDNGDATNGIYIAGASPARAWDMDQDLTSSVPAEEVLGAFIHVIAGTANGGKLFRCTNTTAPTLGVTTLTFAQFTTGGAPDTADYLVGTAQGALSAEIVVGTTPGGELGGTWASPTVDTTHAGTDHLQPVRKNSTGSVFTRRRLNFIEGSNVTLTVADDAGDDEVDVTVAATGSGGTVDIEDEGSAEGAADTIDFTGAGVSVTFAGGQATVNIPGGGAADDPVADLFGAPDTAFEFDSSSFTGLTSLGGTPDVENADTTVPDHYYLQDNATGTNWLGRYAASPSTPFTAIVYVADTSDRLNFNGTGIFIGEATPGKFVTLEHGAFNRHFSVNIYTNRTTYSSTPQAGVYAGTTPGFYLGVLVNSDTDIDFLLSFNGRSWFPILEANNPSLTVGSVGLGINSDNSAGMSAAFGFLRIWNSAKTFP